MIVGKPVGRVTRRARFGSVTISEMIWVSGSKMMGFYGILRENQYVYRTISGRWYGGKR